ncbi:MAG: SsrA-binding protein [Chloroflexi bacterium ADurb.Bin180]|nr:MAG: SsrA-binding protein [Chloroflexi bacterium ADurb.Bin180]HOU24601.1 SsrA-binding protein SmpB [Anaerolineae bacterium]
MTEQRVLASNRKAYHDYFLDDAQEAGIVLTGTEIKSIREGKMNLRDSYVQIRSGQAFLVNAHISPYSQGNRANPDPRRDRKLLLHKREIRRLQAAVQEKGLTIVPLKVYLKNNRAKVEIALARGKKLYDKREAIAKRDSDRQLKAEIKNRR